MRSNKHTTCFKRHLAALLLCLTTLISSQQAHAQSIELDKQLGAENAQMVAAQMGIYDHERLTEYVRKVGNRLVSELEDPQFEFVFQVADDPTPNAFALPGGYVYVTRGILALITTEDELACVLAHEIIHVTQRHSIKQLRKSILPRLLEIPGKLVGKVINEDLGRILNTPITMSNELLLASYSRDSETESDELGVTLASKAGYDPTAMNDILIRLNETVEFLTEQKTRKSYFDDHPFTADRVDSINATAAGLTWQATAPESADIMAELDGMLFDANPANGFFKGNTFLHPDLNFTLSFPFGWEFSNQPTAVGAVYPDRNAFIYVGLADARLTPEQHAQQFMQAAERERDVRTLNAEPWEANQLTGYLVSVEDRTNGAATVIHQLWVELDGKVFQMLGAAPPDLLPELEATAQSLSGLSDEKRSNLNKVVFRRHSLEPGESMQDFNERTKSVAPPEVTAFLNGMKSDQVVESARSMKVLVKESYFP